MEQTRGYICWILDEASRTALLASVPAQFANVIAHHVTYVYDVPSDTPLPEPKTGYVVGEIVDNGVQAVVVEIDGDTVRQDGCRYHVTVSLDEGRFAEQAKHLTLRGWWPLDERIAITLTPVFIEKQMPTP